ncbi:MAG: DNA polymerase III subunit gamma/tau [Vicinamibacterales bacterium]
MSYQVLARKWRPQRFDDVFGQQAVTRTLRNALASGRVAHAFVFAGSRGCGKTTTARILSRALNCVNGPTPDPCGVCDACVEIAQGRDIDVLEIDAASHTGIDNIRDVVIAGLSIAPVRDRYKVFLIDEVHQLSSASFNALLKSIEEPPPHVVFMMATTELHKIPDTILSRSQVFEFKTIPTKLIVEKLRKMADADGLKVEDSALTLVARSAEGSMRDAESALDQVIAFAGETITVDDVSTVLGVVGRDLLFGIVEAVVSEDGPAAFALADRAVEAGHDLKLVCLELTRMVRDLMMVSVDSTRAGDGELLEGERARLVELAQKFSREDLLRAFEVLARAEQDIRSAAHPRYHFEMALLRWMHLRKLVPLTELMEKMGGGGAVLKAPASVAAKVPVAGAKEPAYVPKPAIQRPSPSSAPRAVAPAPGAPAAASPATTAEKSTPVASTGSFKDALLAEIRSGRTLFYNTIVAQAQKIDVTEEKVVFTFSQAHRGLREQFDQAKAWLEATAERVAGRRVSVASVQSAEAVPAVAPAAAPQPRGAASGTEGERDLKAEVLSSPVMQAMLDVFPAQIRDVEEI